MKSFTAKGDEFGNPLQIYSETETLTGEVWIDGSPVYRKVLPFTITGSLTEIDISSINYLVVTNLIMNLLSSDGNYINSFVQQSGPNLVNYRQAVLASDIKAIAIVCNSTEVSTGNTTPAEVGQPGFVILEYTKPPTP